MTDAHSACYGFFFGSSWDALSALATVAAVIVALALPFLIKAVEDRAYRRRLRTSYVEVVSATRSALKCLLWALDDVQLGRSGGALDLTRVSARAAGRGETLRLLATRAGLSDDAVSSCISAAQSMDQITAAARHPAEIKLVNSYMNAALALGHEATERVKEVINGEKIVLSLGDTIPLLPKL